jgi:hypothetical protein
MVLKHGGRSLFLSFFSCVRLLLRQKRCLLYPNNETNEAGTWHGKKQRSEASEAKPLIMNTIFCRLRQTLRLVIIDWGM